MQAFPHHFLAWCVAPGSVGSRRKGGLRGCKARQERGVFSLQTQFDTDGRVYACRNMWPD